MSIFFNVKQPKQKNFYVDKNFFTVCRTIVYDSLFQDAPNLLASVIHVKMQKMNSMPEFKEQTYQMILQKLISLKVKTTLNWLIILISMG